MKKTAARFTALLVLLALFLGACSGATENAQTETEGKDALSPAVPTDASAPAAEEEETEERIPEYPYETADLGGKTFTFLNVADNLWQGTFHVLDYEEESGEGVSDALFRRARMTEEVFNCTINVEKPSGDIGQVYQTLGRAVTAGDDAYDAAYVGLASFGNALSGEYGINLHDIETLRMDERWWNQMFVENMTLNGCLFASIDYVCMMGYGYSNVLFFNQPLFIDRGIPLPYDQVREGAWTYDAMYADMDAVVDLNGEDAFRPTDSNSTALWGYAIQHKEGTMVMLDGSGEFLVTRDADGQPVLRSDFERLHSAYSRLCEMFSQDGYCLNANGPAMNAFVRGDALFFQTALGVAADTFREIEFAYGILPLPKYEESQKDYYTMISEYTLALQIPKTVADPSVSGRVIDFMAYHGYYDIVPVMQNTFCYKGMRDEDSIEMMNITLDTMTVDFGYLYGWTKDSVNTLATNIADGKDTFASSMKSAEKMTKRQIENTMKKWAKQ